jgi:hypothetical protein
LAALRSVASLTDTTFTHGMPGIETGGWYPAYFSNLTITNPATGAAPSGEYQVHALGQLPESLHRPLNTAKGDGRTAPPGSHSSPS